MTTETASTMPTVRPTGMAFFAAVLAIIQVFSPGFQADYKNANGLMKLIGCVLFFNKGFMTDFVTTFWGRTWFPSPEKVAGNPEGSGDTLFHEGVHAFDEYRTPLKVTLFGYRISLVYTTLYLFPASIGIPMFLFGLVMLPVGLIGLLVQSLLHRPFFLAEVLPLAWCMLPGLIVAAIPIAPFRMQIELRGYTMTMLTAYLNGLRKDSEGYAGFMTYIEDQFVGPNYYFMWPFRSSIRKKLDAAWASIESGVIYEGASQEPYRKARDLLTLPRAEG